MKNQILNNNEQQDQYFYDRRANRIVFLPKGWANEIPNLDEEDEVQVYCWFGNQDTLAFKKRTTNEWLTTDAQGWFDVSNLEEMEIVDEAQARELDPNLFELLSFVDSSILH